MKPTIPNAGTVDSVFRALARRLKQVRKEINTQATRKMKAGDYGLAQRWIDVGRSVADFGERGEAFRQEWKQLTRAVHVANASVGVQTPPRAVRKGSSTTPAWKFCTAALEALVSRGGSASQEEVLLDLERSMASDLTEKDRQYKPPRNAPLWHGAVKKAYKQCQREGWTEKRTGGEWKITPRGRAVLARESEGEPGTLLAPKT